MEQEDDGSDVEMAPTSNVPDRTLGEKRKRDGNDNNEDESTDEDGGEHEHHYNNGTFTDAKPVNKNIDPRVHRCNVVGGEERTLLLICTSLF